MSEGMGIEVHESEEELIQKAAEAVNRCSWTVGECAAKWTRKYARGRTDADFAALVGLSPDQVYQRRRVWETFADVVHNYPSLKWSHFYVALNWDDAAECLAWAEENKATVAEMKAWRRLQHGGQEQEEPEEDVPVLTISSEEVIDAKKPEEFKSASTEEKKAESKSKASEQGTIVTGYTPYRKDALTPPPKDEQGSVAVKTAPNTAQILKRMACALERYNRQLTDEMLAEAKQAPEKVRVRLVAAVRELAEKVERLI